MLPFATLSKPCSGYKMKEMTGSGIFGANGKDSASEGNSADSNNRTSIRICQVYLQMIYFSGVQCGCISILKHEIKLNSDHNVLVLICFLCDCIASQQAMNGISQISFSTEESISPKKPTSIPEVAKQRELSGTMQSDSDSKSKKQISNAKTKELTGNDIFGPPPEIVPRSVAAARTMESKESKDMGEPLPRNVRTSVKVSNVSIF